MPVDTDLLGSCGLRFESEIYTDGGYSLSRVDYMGRKLIAEVSDVSGVYQHRWPLVDGLISPVSARDLPAQKKLALFDIGDGTFLCETIKKSGRYSLEKAVEVTRKVLKTVSDLQAAGMISGYIGPEMFVSHGSSILMLAGRRGIPLSPFTAPEVQSTRPSDPRSDVSAIGSFIFRLVAGTDDREQQLKVWHELSPALQAAIQDMVVASPVNRPNGLKAVLAILDNLTSVQAEETCDDIVPDSVDTGGFAQRGKRPRTGQNYKKLYWIAGSALVLLLAFWAFSSSGLPPDSTDEVETIPVEEIQEEPVEVVSPWEDTVVPVDTIVPTAEVPIVDSARIWISNCSGSPDLEHEFRSSSVSGYSYVYPLCGTTNRQSSLILARRADPSIPLAETPLGEAVQQIADSSFSVMPLDMTILLGTDLNYSGINSQFLHSPVAPAGTLYVDVVNHGIQYSLDGLGAATWTAGRIEGKSFDFNGVEWVIAISDIRDADQFSEEIGIPEVLDETLFLYHQTNSPAVSLETLLRQYFQPLPTSSDFPVETVPISDIHILIGRSVSD